MSSNISGNNNADISKKLLESFDLLKKQFNTDDKADIIECSVRQIEDKAQGAYRVSYMGNSFIAYSSATVTYAIGEKVYVLVPKGDLSKTKTIIGSTQPVATVTKEKTDTTEYIIMSDNLASDAVRVGLSTYKSQDPIDGELISAAEIDLTTSDFNTTLSSYLMDYKDILFTATVETSIVKDQQIASGYYGAVLYLPIIDRYYDDEGKEAVRNIYRQIALDTNTMQGNVLNFTIPSLQKIYNDLSDVEYDDSGINKPKIKFFVSGFPKGEEGQEYPDDIFFDNIGVYSVYTLKEEELAGYFLKLEATQGTVFKSGYYNPTKTITPTLIINGSETNIGSREVYWFIQDATVKSRDSEGFYSLGGYGWRCLNAKKDVSENEDGRQTFSYDTSKQTYEINSSEIITNIKIKCIIVENNGDSNINVEQIITLRNLDNINTSIYLQTISGATTFTKNIEYVEIIGKVFYPNLNRGLSETITFDWSYIDSDGILHGDDEVIKKGNVEADFENKIFTQKVSIPFKKIKNVCLVQLAATSVTIYENVKHYKFVGSTELALAAEVGLKYILNINNGDKIYKYDAYGNSPFVAQYDGADTVNKTIKPLSFTIKHQDGVEFTDSEYAGCRSIWRIPKDSLLVLPLSLPKTEEDDFYVITGQGKIEIPYTIKSEYDAQKNNYSILLEIDYGNDVITQSTIISCIKEGENGTNGTKYSAFITWKGNQFGEYNANGIPQKLRYVYIKHAVDKNGKHIEAAEGWKFYDTSIVDKSKRLKSLDDYDLDLAVEVFKNGQAIGVGTEVSVNWKMFDPINTTPCFKLSNQILSSDNILNVYQQLNNATSNILYEKLVLINNNFNTWEYYKTGGEERFPVNIIQARVEVTTDSASSSALGEKTIIYAYYPVEVSFISDLTLEIDEHGEYIIKSFMPELIDGYYNVDYSPSGYNPVWDKNDFYFPVDTIKEEAVDGTISEIIPYHFNWSCSENLRIKTKEPKLTATINPVDNYNLQNSKNYVSVTTNLHQQELDDYINKYNALEEECGDLLQTIDEYEIDLSYYNDLLELAPSIDEVISKFDELMKVAQEVLRFKNNIRISYKGAKETINYLIRDYEEGVFEGVIQVLQDNHYVGKKVKIPKKFFYDKLNLDLYVLLKDYGYIVDEDMFKQELLLKDNTLILENPNKYMKELQLHINEIPDCLQEYNKIIYFNYIEKDQVYNASISVSSFAEVMIRGFSELIRQSDFINRTVQQKITSGLEMLEYSQEQYNLITEDIIDDTNIYLEVFASIPHYILSDKIAEQYDIFDQDVGILYNIALDLDHTKIGNDITIELCRIKKQEYLEALKIVSEQSSVIYLKEIENYFENEYNRLEVLLSDTDEVINTLIDSPIIHIRPIIMLLNRYSNENLNDWDGNKVQLSEDGRSLLAPQIGAGRKGSDNSFTGTVMGIEQSYDTYMIDSDPYAGPSISDKKHRVGLFGYYNGIESFFLDAQTGKSSFGSSKSGQIVIDPSGNDGYIRSGNFVNKDDKTEGAGMEINFSAATITYGSHNFIVDSAGHITAQGGGQIGSWYIGNDNRIYSKFASREDEGEQSDKRWEQVFLNGNTGQIYANEKYTQHWHRTDNGWRKDTNNGFLLDHNGISIGEIFFAGIRTNGEEIDGENPGGILTLGNPNRNEHWNVTTSGVISYNGANQINSNQKNSIYIGPQGISISDFFRAVQSTGSNELLLGNISSTKCWTIAAGNDSEHPNSFISYGTRMFNEFGNCKFGDRSQGTVYLGTDGISLGRDKFYVTPAGQLFSTEGSIGGWKIEKDWLSTEQSTFDKDGNLTGGFVMHATKNGGEMRSVNGTDEWWINSKGECFFNHGTVGGWTITKNSLYAKNAEGKKTLTLNSDGSMNNGDNWSVTSDGKATFKNVTIQNGSDFSLTSAGSIKSTAGSLAGWNIAKGYIESKDKTMKISSTDNNIKGTIEGHEWELGEKCHLPIVYVEDLRAEENKITICGSPSNGGWEITRDTLTHGSASGTLVLASNYVSLNRDGSYISIGGVHLTKDDIELLHKLRKLDNVNVCTKPTYSKEISYADGSSGKIYHATSSVTI